MDKNPLYQGNHYSPYKIKNRISKTQPREALQAGIWAASQSQLTEILHTQEFQGHQRFLLTVKISIIQKKRIIPNECLKEIESLHMYIYIFITCHCKNASILKKHVLNMNIYIYISHIYIYTYTYYKQDILPKSIFLSHKSGFPPIKTQTLIWSNLSKKSPTRLKRTQHQFAMLIHSSITFQLR